MNLEMQSLEHAILSEKDVVIPPFLVDWLHREKRLYIDGEWTEPSPNVVFEDWNPATEEILASVAVAGQREVDLAVQSARAALEAGKWRKTSLEDRAKVLHKIADAIDAHRPALALLESLDSGKPIREAFEGDVPRAALNFRFFADFIKENEPMIFDKPGERHFAVRDPAGVAVLITPWNLPLYLETWKLAPALLMGNSCILKPSEVTPLTACYLAELIDGIGLPKGVFQLLNGFGENSTGQFLTSHPGIDAISFTGETRTGSAIMKAASVGPTKVSFELGGKGASIVFADANLDEAVKTSVRAAFRNQGEICLACPRVFVERKVYDEFLHQFLHETDKIKVGNPLNYGTTMGALVSQEHYDKVNRYFEMLKSDGKVHAGGGRPHHMEKGYFLQPTVVDGLGADHPISREEVFGPLVSFVPFDDEEEVIHAVNDTPYGLSASLWTSNEKRMARMQEGLKVGLLWINCWFLRDLRVPFGGQKKSGVGREGGKNSLDFFSEWKSVCIKV